jgi:hypothetical protein
MITFCGGVLDVARHLLVALKDGRTPTEADRQRLREGIARWQGQVDGHAAAGEQPDDRTAAPAAVTAARQPDVSPQRSAA